MVNKPGWPALMALACLTLNLMQPAMAAEAGGVKFDESSHLGDKELKLNGLGVRTKTLFKIYAIALYLPEKKTATADILALPGPRRIIITMLRDLSSEDFGQAFMNGLHNNLDVDERTKILSQTMAFGSMFSLIPSLKKNDVMTVDWVPAVGTVSYLNGKKLSDPVPELGFYNAILKIWLGDRPADSNLKPKLLGVGA
ncbi:MAG: chalcone isomerase family protein [Pseudomonadota bacterium]